MLISNGAFPRELLQSSIFKQHYSLCALSLSPLSFPRRILLVSAMASATLEDRFEQITIHDDNNENGATSYHKSKVSAQTMIAELH
jgi:hypothetical protein